MFCARVLGVDLETWPLVIAFAAVLLRLTVALLRSQSRTVAAVVAGVEAVFDVAEIVHRAPKSWTSLVVIATLVAVMHFAAVALAVWIPSARRRHAFGPYPRHVGRLTAIRTVRDPLPWRRGRAA
jgi:hypothetical protein